MKHAVQKSLRPIGQHSTDSAPAFTDKAYLTESEVASRLNLSVKWMQKMRHARQGIPYVKFGGAVRYPVIEILNYEHNAKPSIAFGSGDPAPNFARKS